jgi:hypothetical protein
VKNILKQSKSDQPPGGNPGRPGRLPGRIGIYTVRQKARQVKPGILLAAGDLANQLPHPELLPGDPGKGKTHRIIGQWLSHRLPELLTIVNRISDAVLDSRLGMFYHDWARNGKQGLLNGENVQSIVHANAEQGVHAPVLNTSPSPSIECRGARRDYFPSGAAPGECFPLWFGPA